MPEINCGYSISGGGISIPRTVKRTVDGQDSRGPLILPLGQAGTLSTRTDNETGTLTLGADHGIETGQIIDLYWAGGKRTAILVGTVSGTSVPIGADDSGAGDNLPTEATAIVCSPRTQVNAAIDGDALALLAMELGYALPASTAVGFAEFQDADDDIIAPIDFEANVPGVWDIAGGADNPFTGDPITKFFVSSGSATEVATLKLIWGADNTP